MSGHHGEHCQPCGECEWCFTNWRRHKRLKKRTRLLREALRVIVSELNAAGPEEVKQHPVLRAHDRLADRILRELKTKR